MAPLRRLGNRPHLVIIGIVAVVVALSSCIALATIFASWHTDVPHADHLPPRSGIYKRYVVSTEVAECAGVGKELLDQGGSAVDAAIAATLCGGVQLPQSAGIGGGSFMTVYDENTRRGEVIDFRETAPKHSSPDMFARNASLSSMGGLSAAIPGEIAGYRAAWKKYGKVPWSALFNRTIEICERGMPTSNYTALALKAFASVLTLSAAFRDEYFIGGVPSQAGQIVHRHRLCRTLRTISTDPESFYNGSLAADMVADVNDEGGNWTLSDLRDYEVKFRDVIQFPVNSYNFTLLTPPPPSTGALLGLILNVLSGFGFTAKSISAEHDLVHNTSLTLHRVAETFKWAFAHRSLFAESVNSTILERLRSAQYADNIRSQILDWKTFNDTSHYNNGGSWRQDAGTLQTAAVDDRGLAVSITSTVNTGFGSKKMGNRTGIVFNNEMDDFSASTNVSNYHGLSPVASNMIQSGRRPVSSMCPSIVLDGNGRIRLVVGAGGGPRIITATAWAILNHLIFQLPIIDSVDRPRLHHQLSPNVLNYEEALAQEYRDDLAARGHKLEKYERLRPGYVQAIARVQGQWHAVSDERKRGGPAGL